MELVSQNAHGKLLELSQDSTIHDIIHGSQNLEVVTLSFPIYLRYCKIMSGSRDFDQFLLPKIKTPVQLSPDTEQFIY